MALALIASLGLWLRLYKLGRQSFWYDEIASVYYAGIPVSELWGADSHPPLFYLLLHPWLAWFGHHEYELRLLNVLFSMATLVPVYLLGRRIGGPWLGLASAAVFASAPIAVEYAQELRMYALLGLVVAWALVGLAALLDDPARAALGLSAGDAPRGAWTLLGLGSLLALYTQSTALLLPLTTTVLVAVLWWRRPERWRLARNWTLVHGLVLAGWALYWPQLLRQAIDVTTWNWIPQPSIETVFFTELRVLFGIPSLAWLWSWALAVFLTLALFGWRALAPPWRAFLLTAMVLPPLASVALGLLFRPVYLARTLIWTELPAAVLVGAGCVALLTGVAWPAGWRARVLGLVLVLAFSVANHASLRFVFDVSRNADFRSVAEMVIEHTQSGDLVALPRLEHRTLAYYLERAGEKLGRSPPEVAGTFRRGRFHLAAFVLALPERERFFRLEITWLPQVNFPDLLSRRFPCHEVTGDWERSGMILWRYERKAGCSP